MSGSDDTVREVARLLRQQSEMGGTDLYLDDLTRQKILDLAARSRRPGGPGPTTAESKAPAVPERPAAAASRPAAEAPASTRAAAPASEKAPRPEKKDLPVLPASYEELRETALTCTRCRLAETRTQVVFSDGAVDARLVVVGEAPGANEDATGLPFVGAAGQFLDLLLATVDLSRKDSVYICNVLKCRPPGNRNPQADEIEACSPFLTKQLELIAPKALLAVGTFAAQALTGEQKALGKLRGDVHSYQGIPLVVTYHPAALLRNSGWTRSFWDDLQLLRRVMDGG